MDTNAQKSDGAQRLRWGEQEGQLRPPDPSVEADCSVCDHAEFIRRFIDEGVEVDTQDKIASIRRLSENIEVLLENGARISARRLCAQSNLWEPMGMIE